MPDRDWIIDTGVTVTLFPLPYLSAARVSGPDAASFLQAQLSADIARLKDDGCSFACYCSPRGQVFGLLLVCRAPEGFLVLGADSLLPGILGRLRLYVLRARVDLAEIPERMVYGREVRGSEPTEAGVYRPPGGDLAYCVRPPGEPVAGATDRWKELELRRGIAWLGAETAERFIPQMLGFDALGAVSFSKGCYPGQEIIARAKYLGRVKRGLQRLIVEAEPIPAGSAVTLKADGESLEGAVVDSAAIAGGSEGGSLLLVVSPAPTGTIGFLEYLGRSYRCATM
jgi:hypothetical protein